MLLSILLAASPLASIVYSSLIGSIVQYYYSITYSGSTIVQIAAYTCRFKVQKKDPKSFGQNPPLTQTELKKSAKSVQPFQRRYVTYTQTRKHLVAIYKGIVIYIHQLINLLGLPGLCAFYEKMFLYKQYTFEQGLFSL